MSGILPRSASGVLFGGVHDDSAVGQFVRPEGDTRGVLPVEFVAALISLVEALFAAGDDTGTEIEPVVDGHLDCISPVVISDPNDVEGSANIVPQVVLIVTRRRMLVFIQVDLPVRDVALEHRI